MTETTRCTYAAVRWSAFSKYGGESIKFAVALLMARLLAPEYFGLMGMATVLTGFANTFNNLGFNVSIVQRKDVDAILLSTIFWVNLAAYSIATVAVIVTAPLAAWIYDDLRVLPIVVVLSLNIFLSAFLTIPTALLQKRMAFRGLAVREIGADLVTGLVGIAMALFGFGVWALVGATVFGKLSSVVLVNLIEPFRPQFVIDKERLRECMRFGLGITGTNIFNYLARNADNLIIGDILGPIALGYYSFAYKIMLLPREALTQVINRVLFSKLALIQDDDAALRRTCLMSCTAIASLSFPMAGGMMILAEPGVELVLESKWLPAVPLIWILAPLGALQSLWSIATHLMLAKGRSDLYFRWGIANGCSMMGSFLIGIPWGTIGVASAYGLACLVWVPITFVIAFRLVPGLKVSALFKQLMPYFFLTLVMMGITYLTFVLVSISLPAWSALVLAVVVGASSYLGSLVALRLQAVDLILGLTSKRLQRAWQTSRQQTTANTSSRLQRDEAC